MHIPSRQVTIVVAMRMWLPAVLLLAGCGVRLRPTVSVESIEPAAGAQGTAVAVRIRGSGFAAASRVDFASGSLEIEAVFEAWLDDTPLVDVLRVDGSTLTATVPATVSPGPHTLIVKTPQGVRTTLAAAFNVVPRHCSVDVDCDDGDVCDGGERCDAGSCVAGLPLVCPAPADPCRAAACDPTAGCVSRPSTLADADGDGHRSTACGGDDCDDDPAACGAGCHPGALETCDGFDSDCDPATPDAADETLLGRACDGPDADLCLDDAYACEGGKLTCSTGPDDVEGPYASPTCGDGADNDCDGTADSQGVGSLPADPKCTLNLPPAVALHVRPLAGEVGATFAADASDTADDRDSLSALRFDWSFGDGVTLAAGSATVTHTYGAAGDRRVEVTVTDTGGKAASAGVDVVVAAAGTLVTVDSEAALRAALAAAALTPQRDVIRVTAVSIALSATLTIGTDVELVSDGTTFSAAYGSGPCVVLLASNIHLVGFGFTACPIALQLTGGTGTQVEACSFHDNVGVVVWGAPGNTFGPANDVGPNPAKDTVGVEVTAPGIFDGNRIHDNGSHGLEVRAGSGSLIERNVIFGNGGAGVIIGAGVSGTKVWFNTIDRNGADGLRVQASSGTQVYDNLFTNNRGFGLNPQSGASLTEDFNDLFPSGRACNGCTVGSRSLQVSPGYVSPGGGDYRLLPGSQVLDAGLDLGVDTNGALPGLYSGAAPDLGALESP